MVHQNRDNAVQCQEIVFTKLIASAVNTAFGKEHSFKTIRTYNDFKNNVPVRTYEQMLPYTARIFAKEEDVLWPGLPAWFGKSSGTTDGAKYLPLTTEHLNCTQFAARYMIANLVDQLGNTGFIGGKVFYQADPQIFEMKNEFKCASISAIKSYRMPKWTQLFALPGKKIDAIEIFEYNLRKVRNIYQEILHQRTDSRRVILCRLGITLFFGC